MCNPNFKPCSKTFGIITCIPYTVHSCLLGFTLLHLLWWNFKKPAVVTCGNMFSTCTLHAIKSGNIFHMYSTWYHMLQHVAYDQMWETHGKHWNSCGLSNKWLNTFPILPKYSKNLIMALRSHHNILLQITVSKLIMQSKQKLAKSCLRNQSSTFLVVSVYCVLLPLSPANDSPTFLRVTAPSSTSFRVTTLCVAAESFCREPTYCSSSLQKHQKHSGKDKDFRGWQSQVFLQQ